MAMRGGAARQLAIVLAWTALALAAASVIPFSASAKQRGSRQRAEGTLPGDVYPDSGNRLPALKRNDLNERGRKVYDEAVRVKHLAGAVLLSVAVTTPQSLHVEVSDPTGDSAAPRSAPTLNDAPDLIAAVADVVAGKLTITIRFAPGTFDRTKMGVFVYLDTDDNPLTPAGGGGYEYFVGSNTGGIMKYHSGDRTTVLAKVAFSRDQVRLTIPLKNIGNRDGNIAFRVAAYTRSAPSAVAVQAIVDEMPDRILPAARLR